MKNEAEFKSLIKKSVSAQKGYSISLAAPMLSGIPDLYVVMPTYIPVLLEAKWLGEIKREVFSRKPQFTSMQINFLQSCHDVSPYSAMGVIGFIYNGLIHASLVPFGAPLFYNFTQNFVTETAWIMRDPLTKKLDIMGLFGKVPIPKIRNIYLQGLDDISDGNQKLDMAV